MYGVVNNMARYVHLIPKKTDGACSRTSCNRLFSSGNGSRDKRANPTMAANATLTKPRLATIACMTAPYALDRIGERCAVALFSVAPREAGITLPLVLSHSANSLSLRKR